MLLYDLIVGIISNLISNKIQKNIEVKENVSTKEKIKLITQEATLSVPETRSYIEEVAERLNVSIEHLNTREGIITFSLICDFLNWKSVSEIEDYFLGKKEPSLIFLEGYSNFFGIELDWLRHGKGNIFMKLNQPNLSILGCLKYIVELNPEQIYFVRSKCNDGYSGIILKMSNYKYLILPKNYKISSNVGEGGSREIEEFFDLIKSLSLRFGGYKLNGLIISEDMFSDLFSGKLYFGKLIKTKSQINYWWDDFLDYEHKMPISINYERFYGVEFIKAQQIVKWRKEKKSA